MPSAVICRCNQAFRFSFGATYAANDSQIVKAGEPLEINGPAAKLAISFERAGGEIETPVIDPSYDNRLHIKHGWRNLQS